MFISRDCAALRSRGRALTSASRLGSQPRASLSRKVSHPTACERPSLSEGTTVLGASPPARFACSFAFRDAATVLCLVAPRQSPLRPTPCLPHPPTPLWRKLKPPRPLSARSAPRRPPRTCPAALTAVGETAQAEAEHGAPFPALAASDTSLSQAGPVRLWGAGAAGPAGAWKRCPGPGRPQSLTSDLIFHRERQLTGVAEPPSKRSPDPNTLFSLSHLPLAPRGCHVPSLPAVT